MAKADCGELAQPTLEVLTMNFEPASDAEDCVETACAYWSGYLAIVRFELLLKE